jgi:hypothetical protein
VAGLTNGCYAVISFRAPDARERSGIGAIRNPESKEMQEEKLEVITFKVPEYLKEAMKGIPNRSEFIRTAILAALGNICPLCNGTGILLPNQKKHWDHFAKHHFLEECKRCNAVHLVCERGRTERIHG